jgi:hypothetical protein
MPGSTDLSFPPFDPSPLAWAENHGSGVTLSPTNSLAEMAMEGHGFAIVPAIFPTSGPVIET